MSLQQLQQASAKLEQADPSGGNIDIKDALTPPEALSSEVSLDEMGEPKEHVMIVLTEGTNFDVVSSCNNYQIEDEQQELDNITQNLKKVRKRNNQQTSMRQSAATSTTSSKRKTKIALVPVVEEAKRIKKTKTTSFKLERKKSSLI